VFGWPLFSIGIMRIFWQFGSFFLMLFLITVADFEFEANIYFFFFFFSPLREELQLFTEAADLNEF